MTRYFIHSAHESVEGFINRVKRELGTSQLYAISSELPKTFAGGDAVVQVQNPRDTWTKVKLEGSEEIIWAVYKALLNTAKNG